MNKHQLITLLAFLLLAFIVICLVYLVNNFGWLNTSIGFISLIAISSIFYLVTKKIRFNRLYKKYSDEELVNKIIKRTIWQGQTAEQVLDAIGKPKDIDQKALKTKTKETWKYFPSGRRRYGLRIMLDDGVVVGWDNKL